MTSTEEFNEFAAGAAPRLRRTAFLLCGDWHAAEDLAQATLTTISAATGKPGRPVDAGPWVDMLAVTPDGKTVYAVDQESGQVIPVSVATGAARRAIKVAGIPFAIAITADAKTAFVLGEKSTLTPITLATGRVRKAITIPPVPAQSGLSTTPVISRDGRTIYAVPTSVKGRVLVPVDVASGRAEQPIRLSSRPDAVVLSPDGRTLYLVNSVGGSVTPLVVATGEPGRPIRVGSGPDGDGLYAGRQDRLRGQPGFRDGDADRYGHGADAAGHQGGEPPLAITITPDGKTAYVVNNGSHTVTPIETAGADGHHDQR